MRTFSVCLPLALALPVALAAPAAAAAATPVVITAVPAEGAGAPIDNLHFGLASLQGPGIAGLFGSGQALNVGLDYDLGRGFALALDSFNLFQEYAANNYLLSINPLELRYRVALPLPGGGALSPFATVGAGASLMGLLGGPDARLGVGPAVSASLGTLVGAGLALQLGVQAGQVGQIPYGGWQVQLGTGFRDLAGWVQPAASGAARPTERRQARQTREETGRVRAVRGDRLAIDFEGPHPPAVGRELVVFYRDGVPIKVARARLTGIDARGHAVARVWDSTETVKAGYWVDAN